MKRVLSMLLVFLICCVCFCGCNNSKYDEALKYFNNGDYELALPLFEELAEKNYNDSAEMVKETKYQFAVENNDEENSTVYEYLSELVADNYKDSKNIYDRLYTWKFNIAFSKTKQSLFHEDTIIASTSFAKFYYINLQITGGKPGESLHGEYVIKYSNGQESRDDFYDGGGAVLSLMCSATQAPLGKTVFSLYDDSGKLLASKSAVIK